MDTTDWSTRRTNLVAARDELNRLIEEGDRQAAEEELSYEFTISGELSRLVQFLHKRSSPSTAYEIHYSGVRNSRVGFNMSTTYYYLNLGRHLGVIRRLGRRGSYRYVSNLLSFAPKSGGADRIGVSLKKGHELLFVGDAEAETVRFDVEVATTH